MPLSVALEPREPGADAGSTQNRATEALVRAYFSVHYEHPPVGTAWWQIDQRLDQWIHGFRWLSAVTHRGPGLAGVELVDQDIRIPDSVYLGSDSTYQRM